MKLLRGLPVRFENQIVSYGAISQISRDRNKSVQVKWNSAKKGIFNSASTCLGWISDEHLVEETLELGGHLLVLQLGRRHVSDTPHCLHTTTSFMEGKKGLEKGKKFWKKFMFRCSCWLTWSSTPPPPPQRHPLNTDRPNFRFSSTEAMASLTPPPPPLFWPISRQCLKMINWKKIPFKKSTLTHLQDGVTKVQFMLKILEKFTRIRNPGKLRKKYLCEEVRIMDYL